VLRLLLGRGLISQDVVDNLLSWRHSGFSVHSDVMVPDREAVDRPFTTRGPHPHPLVALDQHDLRKRDLLSFGLFYERHFRGDEIDDFNVYRTRLEVRMDGIKNEPWVQQDFFFDHARGFFRTRSRGGLLWNFRNNQEVRLGYQFQYTQDLQGNWGPQHAIIFRYWFGSSLSQRRVN